MNLAPRFRALSTISSVPPGPVTLLAVPQRHHGQVVLRHVQAGMQHPQVGALPDAVSASLGEPPVWLLNQIEATGFSGLIGYSWWGFWHLVGYFMIPPEGDGTKFTMPAFILQSPLRSTLPSRLHSGSIWPPRTPAQIGFLPGAKLVPLCGHLATCHEATPNLRAVAR